VRFAPYLFALLVCCADGEAARPGPDLRIDVSALDAASAVHVTVAGGAVTATWPAGDGRDARIVLDFGGPLASSIAISPSAGAEPTVVASELTPRFEIVTGSRNGSGYVFFDSPADRPNTRARASLYVTTVRAESQADRATITFAPLVAGDWTGELAVHLYASSPLVHFEARLTQPHDGVAYYYDAGLDGVTGAAAWIASGDDGPDAMIRRASLDEPRSPRSVRYRTICAESDAGTLAVFPAPHAYFFARDLSTNLSFVEAGDRTIGIRQAPSGGGSFSPWYDAPAGSVQRMDLFVLADAGRADDALARIRRYTHDDSFPKVPGRITHTSHWHSRLTQSDEQGKPNAPELVHVMKRLGVNAVHLAEFHYDAHPDDPGTARLDDQRRLFDIVRLSSDSELALVPGEEGMDYFGGHWMLLFPKPVYFTWKSAAGAVFLDERHVYHLASRDDAWKMIRAENGMSWTSHPRAKASEGMPDAYRDSDFYRDDRWLGATWKAMPSDLSLPHLGDRSFVMFDDMLAWGPGRKRLIGEVDVFEIDRTHELYGYMNVNYLALDAVPPPGEWSAIMPVLARGDFFTTTGEVILHSFAASETTVSADVEWTLPLDHARVVFSRGGTIERIMVPLLDTAEHGRRSFEWPLDMRGADWARIEVWDIARDGAFTQALDVR
jgi:hypothetical protein